MKKIVLLSLVFVTTFVSCKNNEVSKNESVATEGSAEVKQDTVFTITLNATVLKDDSFQVYYKNDEMANYEEVNSLFTEFKGSDKPQDIVFRLPDGIIPDYIRMDFGVNKEQTEVKINSYKMSYFGKEFKTNNPSEFFKLILIEPKTANVDAENGIIMPINMGDVHDPLGTSEKRLYDEIQKIVK
jgi:hypothetical protein